MEPASPLNQDHPEGGKTLENQLREMYGRVAYTHKTHEKMADGFIKKYRFIKGTEIVVSAIATSSLLLAVFGESRCGTITGAVFSTILLGLTLYFKEGSMGEHAQQHTVVASKLWGIREELLSLLVDFRDGKPLDAIRNERDRINASLEAIYKGAPRTSPEAYAAAQKALKESEELYFSDSELDKMLPKQLRVSKE